MAKIYYNRIKRDPSFTINDVPETNGWRVAVQAMLDAEQ